MRLGHVELFCKDCETTRDFYVFHLGFEQTEIQGGKFIWLRSDGFELLLRPGRTPKSPPDYSQARAALVIYCSDIVAMSEKLVHHNVPMGAPDGSPDCITFQDPDGRWLQAVENY